MSRFGFALALVVLTAVAAVAEPTLNIEAARVPMVPMSVPPKRLSGQDQIGWKTADWESHLISDLADGSLDQRSLLDAALIVGGVRNQQALRICQQRWRQLLAELDVTRSTSHHDKTVQVFRFMHAQILTGDYYEACNALDRTLLDGDYNCVTATIVFCCLARHCGIPLQPVSLPGHVLCRVTGDTRITVETTDANWEPATDEYDGSFQGRLLTDVELLAKLFYNRGLAKLAQREFGAALAATELSWQLDRHHESARDNVATVINNWALDLTTKSQFEQALSLLDRGRQLVPDHPILDANQAHIRDAWSRQMNAGGKP